MKLFKKVLEVIGLLVLIWIAIAMIKWFIEALILIYLITNII